MTDYNGHGTIVASVAAGAVRGVAPKADLVIVKHSSAVKNAETGGFDPVEGNIACLEDAIDWVINDVATRKADPANQAPGRSIINISSGIYVAPLH